jgi:hypothetical protein
VSVVVKETQAGTYYTVIITRPIFLMGGHPVGLGMILIRGIVIHLPGVTKKFSIPPFRITDLAGNSFQIFEFKGVIRKIFRNKELACLACSQDFGTGA